MINTYAQAFMIAARTEPVAPPRLLAARDPHAPRRAGRWFRRLVGKA